MVQIVFTWNKLHQSKNKVRALDVYSGGDGTMPNAFSNYVIEV